MPNFQHKSNIGIIQSYKNRYFQGYFFCYKNNTQKLKKMYTVQKGAYTSVCTDLLQSFYQLHNIPFYHYEIRI